MSIIIKSITHEEYTVNVYRSTLSLIITFINKNNNNCYSHIVYDAERIDKIMDTIIEHDTIEKIIVSKHNIIVYYGEGILKNIMLLKSDDDLETTSNDSEDLSTQSNKRQKTSHLINDNGDIEIGKSILSNKKFLISTSSEIIDLTHIEDYVICDDFYEKLKRCSIATTIIISTAGLYNHYDFLFDDINTVLSNITHIHIMSCGGHSYKTQQSLQSLPNLEQITFVDFNKRITFNNLIKNSPAIISINFVNCKNTNSYSKKYNNMMSYVNCQP